MSILKEKGVPVEINGMSYNLIFSLNTLNELLDEYGSLEEYKRIISTGLPQEIMQFVLFLLTLMVNDDIEYQNERLPRDEWKPLFTIRGLGRLINGESFPVYQSKVYEAISKGNPDITKEEMDKALEELKNAQAKQEIAMPTP